MLRQGQRCRVVEDQGRGQPETDVPVQPVPQFHGGQGVESELGEGLVDPHVRGGAVAQYDGDPGAHEFHDPGQLVVVGAVGELGYQSLVTGRGPGGPTVGDAHESAQHRGEVLGAGTHPQRCQVEPDGCDDGGVDPEGRVEQCQAVGRGQRWEPGPLHPPPVGLGQPTGHAAFRPRAPCQRPAGQAEVPAVLGERVEERVRGRIAPLTG